MILISFFNSHFLGVLCIWVGWGVKKWLKRPHVIYGRPVIFLPCIMFTVTQGIEQEVFFIIYQCHIF